MFPFLVYLARGRETVVSGKNEKKPAIYKKIKEALLEDGSLPKGFGLHANHLEWYLCYVDGAYDSRMHYQPALIPEQPFEPVKGIIKAVGQGNIKKASKRAEKYFKKNKCLPIMEPFRKWINGQTMYLKHVTNFCWNLITQSDNAEAVKFGLVFMEVLDTGADPELVKVVRCLAVCEEFTFYCLYLIGRWANSNEEIFSLAQRLRGWGKTYAVRLLKPENEAIRRWIVTEGCICTAGAAFLALDCAKKVDLEEYLSREGITREDVDGAEMIIGGIMDESQLKGISIYPEPVPMLLAYLWRRKEFIPSAEGFDVIAKIALFVEKKEGEGWNVCLALARELMEQTLGREIISKGIYRGAGFGAAVYLDIDYAPLVFERMEEEFDTYFYLCQNLMAKNKMVDECIALFEARLPLEEMEQGMDGRWYFEANYKMYQRLNFITSLLGLHPGKGIRLLQCAFVSPASSSRKIALVVLEIWMLDKEDSLRHVYPQLYTSVRKAILRERKRDMRRKLEELVFTGRKKRRKAE